MNENGKPPERPAPPTTQDRLDRAKGYAKWRTAYLISRGGTGTEFRSGNPIADLEAQLARERKTKR